MLYEDPTPATAAIVRECRNAQRILPLAQHSQWGAHCVRIPIWASDAIKNHCTFRQDKMNTTWLVVLVRPSNLFVARSRDKAHW